MDVEKFTNGIDADDPTGPFHHAGQPGDLDLDEGLQSRTPGRPPRHLPQGCCRHRQRLGGHADLCQRRRRRRHPGARRDLDLSGHRRRDRRPYVNTGTATGTASYANGTTVAGVAKPVGHRQEPLFRSDAWPCDRQGCAGRRRTRRERGGDGSRAGDHLSITVTNTGNVTLTNVMVSDPGGDDRGLDQAPCLRRGSRGGGPEATASRRPTLTRQGSTTRRRPTPTRPVRRHGHGADSAVPTFVLDKVCMFADETRCERVADGDAVADRATCSTTR